MSGKPALRSSIERIRRADLIEAAYLTFLEHGLSGLTMARIGERAGMSHGIVNYYFRGKDELLSAVVRRASFAIIALRARNLRAASTPRERLSATIASNFAADLYTTEIARAWVSYYAEIGKHPEFERLQNAIDRRLFSNLLHDLRRLAPPAPARAIATEVAVLIDGLWLRHAKSGDDLGAAAAIGLVEAHVAQRLAGAAPQGPADGAAQPLDPCGPVG